MKKQPEKKIYFTITGLQFRYGTGFLEREDVVRLVKEPDNEHDKEAIRVEVDGLGKIGYVANSVRTVLGDCFSAGRIYDQMARVFSFDIISLYAVTASSLHKHIGVAGLEARVIACSRSSFSFSFNSC